MELTLTKRINYFEYLFELLQETNSRNEKEDIVNTIPDELKSDWEYILECLTNRVVFGYKMSSMRFMVMFRGLLPENRTIKDILKFLQGPKEDADLSNLRIVTYLNALTEEQYDFFEPIVDKTLRLGIGQSLLQKDDFSAMLAKKFEGQIKSSSQGYFITEKLDGNRCIAHYDGTKWVFTSRNGKPMHVDFDMTGLPTEFTYDGEVLSPEQVELSNKIYSRVIYGKVDAGSKHNQFNTTSGLINRHDTNKKLVFNIFDIQDNASYYYRREFIDNLANKLAAIERKNDVRILPTLGKYNNYSSFDECVYNILDMVTEMGGEGIMINLGNASYEHKRTDSLLKLKKVKTIDMLVTGIEWGSGKYEGQIGAITCSSETDDGKHITCSVGTGLSDDQRFDWAIHPENIKGKIVEVAYFEISQNKDQLGTNFYSLRFPRLKKVRQDKVTTSEY